MAACDFNAILSFSWAAASFLTAQWWGRGEAVALIGGQTLACAGMTGLAIGFVDLQPAFIGCLTAMVGFGVGCCNLHLTSATMSSALPGEESITASSIRSEEHTSEVQSLMRISYAVLYLKKKKTK